MNKKKSKLRVDLIPAVFIKKVAKVMEFGAEKYGELSYLDESREPELYLNAIIRHTLQLKDGAEIDEESDEHHSAHIACNALILLHKFYLKNG